MAAAAILDFCTNIINALFALILHCVCRFFPTEEIMVTVLKILILRLHFSQIGDF